MNSRPIGSGRLRTYGRVHGLKCGMDLSPQSVGLCPIYRTLTYLRLHQRLQLQSKDTLN